MTSLSLTLPASKSPTSPAPAPKVFLSSSLPVFLDSGGTLSILPASIVRPLAAAFPGAQNVGSGQYTVPCSAMNQTGFVDFGFGEKIIKVPWKEFVWFVEPGLCALGLMEGGEGTNILGDTFLRAAFGEFMTSFYLSTACLTFLLLSIIIFLISGAIGHM